MMYKILPKKAKMVSESRKTLSGIYDKVLVECSPLLHLIGSLNNPIKKGEVVKYWIDEKFNVCVSPCYRIVPHVFWAANIIWDRGYYLQIQNCLGLWANYPYSLSRKYLEIVSHELCDNTVILKLMKEGIELQRYMVFWDYTVLDMQCQLKIIMQVAKWHSSPKINITIKKVAGIAEFASHATIHDIREFIDKEHLHGEIWFVEISDAKMANRYIPHIHKLVDPAMYYYTSMEMDNLIDKYTQ